MAFSPAPLDPKQLTRSEAFPWLSSRLQFSSRTLWIVLWVSLSMAMLFASRDNQQTLYAIMALIVFVFLFVVSRLLRSPAPVPLLLVAFFAEFGLLELLLQAFGADDPLDPLQFGLAASLSIVAITAAILLLAWGIAKLRAEIVPAPIKSALWSWSGLDRATTIVMITVAAAAAAAATVDTVDQYAYSKVIYPTLVRIYSILNNSPVPESKFPISFTYKFVIPAISRDRPEQVSWEQWKVLKASIALDSAYLEGAIKLLPRGLTFLLGYGAYGALIGFVIAFARTRDVKKAARPLVGGIGVSITLYGLWTSLAEDSVAPFPLAMLALAGGLVLVAMCVYAVDFDRCAGLADVEGSLGTSFVPSVPKRTGSGL